MLDNLLGPSKKTSTLGWIAIAASIIGLYAKMKGMGDFDLIEFVKAAYQEIAIGAGGFGLLQARDTGVTSEVEKAHFAAKGKLTKAGMKAELEKKDQEIREVREQNEKIIELMEQQNAEKHKG